MTPTLAIQLRFGLQLVDDTAAARCVAEVLTRPCFRGLNRLSARWNSKWTHHTEPGALAIARHLTNSFVDGARLDAKQGREIVAMCDVENGTRIRDLTPPAVRYAATMALPFDAASIDDVVKATCDLASCLRVATGYIALEPRFGWAYELAVDGARPRERPGISTQRLRERRARVAYEDRLATELVGIEWGTFLGAGHLARIDVDAVRSSGAFARVVQLSPELVYLQVTEHAEDDSSHDLEARLVEARKSLAPVLMPMTRISLA